VCSDESAGLACDRVYRRRHRGGDCRSSPYRGTPTRVDGSLAHAVTHRDRAALRPGRPAPTRLLRRLRTVRRSSTRRRVDAEDKDIVASRRNEVSAAGYAVVRRQLTAVALAMAALGISAASASTRPPERVTLDHGSLLGQPWRAALYKNTAGSPCYQLDTHVFQPPIGVTTSVCGRPRRGFIPTLAGKSGSGSTRGHVLIMVTPLRVRRVELRLSHGRRRELRPHRIKPRKAHRVGLDATFRYAVSTIRGSSCLRRHIDYTAAGRTYYRSLRYGDCR
jgi:hypothetical protein